MSLLEGRLNFLIDIRLGKLFELRCLDSDRCALLIHKVPAIVNKSLMFSGQGLRTGVASPSCVSGCPGTGVQANMHGISGAQAQPLGGL